MASDAQSRSSSADASSSLGGYSLAVLAEVPHNSSFYFCFDERTVDLFRPGEVFPWLFRAEALSSSLEEIVFPPIQPGWRRCGVACFYTGSSGRIDLSRTLPFGWALAFQWHTSRSAWQALLEAQEALQPQQFSLSPDLIVPALFLAHLGMAPLGTNAADWVAHWGPFLADSQSDLVTLIQAWYLEWIHGPSEAARRYRQLNNIAPQRHPFADPIILMFDSLFGEKFTASLRTAERLEPVLLRGLARVSTQLFDSPTRSAGAEEPSIFFKYPDWIPPPRKRRPVVLPPAEQLLRGLLSLASWQLTSLPQEIEDKHPRESEGLLQAWIAWRASSSKELPA